MLTLVKVNDLRYIDDMIRLLSQLTDVSSTISEEKVEEIINIDNFNYYLLSLDDNIIGIGGLMIRKTFCHDCRSIGYIEDIVIDENHRGKGYGNFLIQEIIKKAKENNCYKVILQCSPDKRVFYEKNGFTSNTIGCSIYFD